MQSFMLYLRCALLWTAMTAAAVQAEDWPRWRGPGGGGVSKLTDLPQRWSRDSDIAWRCDIPGEGSSSPIVWQDLVFLTSAEKWGAVRWTHCLDRRTGNIRWSRSIEDELPELTSALTGHAASTPVTDGEHVAAVFGNAGVVCYDMDGTQLWRHDWGEFESELGFASSPIFYQDLLIVVCDHDGDKFSSFTSFVAALDKRTGQQRWRTERPGLFRSWSTPIVVAGPQGDELIINAQDELRAYDPLTGTLLWKLGGMTGWVTPSPVFNGQAIFATSGRDGPLVSIRPGARGAADEHVVWRLPDGGPYVCSPLVVDGRLYVLDERGILRCLHAEQGTELYRQRLDGKFFASPVAGDGKLYCSNDAGITYVVRLGDKFELLSTNRLDEEILASPAIIERGLLLRTRSQLVCVSSGDK